MKLDYDKKQEILWILPRDTKEALSLVALSKEIENVIINDKAIGVYVNKNSDCKAIDDTTFAKKKK